MKVPFDNEESSGIVYVWIGSKADTDEARLIEEIAEEMFNNVSIHNSGMPCLANNYQFSSLFFFSLS